MNGCSCSIHEVTSFLCMNVRMEKKWYRCHKFSICTTYDKKPENFL